MHLGQIRGSPSWWMSRMTGSLRFLLGFQNRSSSGTSTIFPVHIVFHLYNAFVVANITFGKCWLIINGVTPRLLQPGGGRMSFFGGIDVAWLRINYGWWWWTLYLATKFELILWYRGTLSMSIIRGSRCHVTSEPGGRHRWWCNRLNCIKFWTKALVESIHRHIWFWWIWLFRARLTNKNPCICKRCWNLSIVC